MALATLKKPAAAPSPAKGTVKGGKPEAKDTAKTPAKSAAKKTASKAVSKPKAPAKPQKAFEPGELVEFRGYAQPPKEGQTPTFKEGTELAVVGLVTQDGIQLVTCVATKDFDKYTADPNDESVDGENYAPVELKRLNRKVEEAYHLPMVGEMGALMKDGDDPLEVATTLYNNANKAFFYFGGVLARLLKERNESGAPLYTNYKNDKKKTYANDKDGLRQFLADHFGEEFGIRKAEAHVAIYERVSSLADAETHIAKLPEVGWWKVSMIANYLTDANATKLLEVAAAQNEDDLRETLKTKYTTEGKNAQNKSASRATVKKTRYEFVLFENQGVGIDYIFKQAKSQTKITDDNDLFEHIVTEWANDHLGDNGDVANRAKALVEKATKTLEKSNVKLPANHPLAKKQAAEAAAATK
jgi:hypothetical protein